MCLSSCSKSGISGSVDAPAGGFILYDCDADNARGNPDGLKSKECGWRYIEVAPSDLSGVYEISDRTTITTKTVIGTAEENTKTLAENSTVSTDAAKNALDYSITVNGVTYDEWYLPSKDELHLMREKLHRKGGGGFSDNYYWSSSVGSANGKYTGWNEYFHSGKQSTDSRGFGFQVRPIRYLK
jgi:hypothetical protein